MKKYFLILFCLFSIVALSQRDLKYSGFFDSYYTKGPLKYFIEPGVTMINGELEDSQFSGGVGAGVNYRVLPSIYLNGSIRYMNLQSRDHDDKRLLSFSGSAVQFNAIANYHFIYDIIRDSWHRRRGPKKINAYLSTGLSFKLYDVVNTSHAGTSTFGTTFSNETTTIINIFSKFSQVVQFPVGIGIPIRVTPRFTLTPELMAYYSFSDKIDGIVYPQTNAKDSYAFINIKFMFNPKGKRLHPKQPKASNNGGSTGNNENSDTLEEEIDKDSFNDKENFDTSENENTEEEVIEEENDEIEEEIIEEKIENVEDEDGFLIDE